MVWNLVALNIEGSGGVVHAGETGLKGQTNMSTTFIFLNGAMECSARAPLGQSQMEGSI